VVRAVFVLAEQPYVGLVDDRAVDHDLVQFAVDQTGDLRLGFCFSVRLQNPSPSWIAQCAQQSRFYLLRRLGEV
jgi:hypothetical protein